MLIDYTRVSTDDQHLNLQHEALQKAGCEKVYSYRQSGATTERPGLFTVFKVLRPGDAQLKSNGCTV
jgi:DNA invertase Pin-like site-specific DNA recombinase